MDSRWGKRPPKWTLNILSMQLAGRQYHLLRRAPKKKRGNRFADDNQAFVFGRVECEVTLRHLTGYVKKTAGYTDPKL